MEQLRKRIEELMSENEIVKANAMKVITCDPTSETAKHMWTVAKRENIAYQKVIDEMNKIVAGRIVEDGGK